MSNYSSNETRESHDKNCGCDKHVYTTTGYYKCSYYPTPWYEEKEQDKECVQEEKECKYKEKPKCREEKQSCECEKQRECEQNYDHDNKQKNCGCNKENECNRPCQRQNRCCLCNRWFW